MLRRQRALLLASRLMMSPGGAISRREAPPGKGFLLWRVLGVGVSFFEPLTDEREVGLHGPGQGAFSEEELALPGREVGGGRVCGSRGHLGEQ